MSKPIQVELQTLETILNRVKELEEAVSILGAGSEDKIILKVIRRVENNKKFKQAIIDMYKKEVENDVI